MTQLGEQWDKITAAIQFVVDGNADRLDGDGWSVYAVGSNIVRIDLRLKRKAAA